jgi:hypothetical protein
MTTEDLIHKLRSIMQIFPPSYCESRYYLDDKAFDLPEDQCARCKLSTLLEEMEGEVNLKKWEESKY